MSCMAAGSAQGPSAQQEIRPLKRGTSICSLCSQLPCPSAADTWQLLGHQEVLFRKWNVPCPPRNLEEVGGWISHLRMEVFTLSEEDTPWSAFLCVSELSLHLKLSISLHNLGKSFPLSSASPWAFVSVMHFFLHIFAISFLAAPQRWPRASFY